MDEQQSADAPSESTEPELISRAEAEAAFKKRDAAKAEARELKAKLAELEKQSADAERLKAEQDGDLRKQLELMAKERDALTERFESMSAEYNGLQGQIRASKIEAAVLAEVQGDRDVAAELLSNILGQLDDGTGEIEDVSAAASEKLKRYAPHLFKAAPQPTRGFMPPDQSRAAGLSIADTQAGYAAIHGRAGGKKLI